MLAEWMNIFKYTNNHSYDICLKVEKTFEFSIRQIKFYSEEMMLFTHAFKIY